MMNFPSKSLLQTAAGCLLSDLHFTH